MRSWLTLRETQGKLDRSDVVQVQDRRSERRAERWAIRRGMRSLVKGRSAGCGLPGGREDGSVVLKVTDATGTSAEATTGANGRIAGFSGLWTCGMVWMCPECSVRIGAKRAEEVATVLAHHLAEGGDPLLITLTMRHHRQHSLAECLKALTVAWGKVTQGRAAQDDYRMLGLRGWVRALEITHSVDNGWHVHLHILMVVEQGMSDDAIEALTGGWFARWSAGLVKAGMPAPTEERGVDVQRADAAAMPETSGAWARYVCKGLASEAVMGSTKAARGTSRSIYELMRDATVGRRFENPDTGDVVQLADMQARALLAEYETAIRGRKQLTWSLGSHDLRTGVDMEPEQSDEDIVAEDLEGEPVAVIPPHSWKIVEPRAAELLHITERAGDDAARAWLDDLGVEWWLPTGLTDTRRPGVAPGADG
ncbi:protein rep [Pseudonocardia sp. Ae717_Ps2]|uniref:protein rep n=2 Tax=Pseudonocardia sp. Ae717_Ps2 TaxID=1885573 RepID=UPI001179ED53|nr:protein rep [Pseudonocardia sp. Ae717_Ps2]